MVLSRVEMAVWQRQSHQPIIVHSDRVASSRAVTTNAA